MVRLVSRELNMLIPHRTGVDGDKKRLRHNELNIAFGSSYKELSGGMKLTQFGKVDIRLVHHVIGRTSWVACLK